MGDSGAQVTDRPRVALLTREYPPEVYGGAGVHVAELSRTLRAHVDVEVHAFGAPRHDPLVAASYVPWRALDGSAPELAALRSMSVDLAMAADVDRIDLVHSHTWYANLAGHLTHLLRSVPHVVTTHSLEPLRPWKREQLGGGYELSSFCERTGVVHADAVIAVSRAMRADILQAYPEVDPSRVEVIHNGVDPVVFDRDERTDVLETHGVDPTLPTVAFVGRITRQKGVTHLLDAARHLPAGSQLVLCAGAADTPEIAAEFRARVDALADAPVRLVWIEGLPWGAPLVQVLSHSDVFACPSVYEPFGIVNLEAMACGLPVVATAVGGIPEIVVPGETGELVQRGAVDAAGEPLDPDGFARAFGAALVALLDDPARARAMGRAGRARVEQHFTWERVAARTADLYRRLLR